MSSKIVVICGFSSSGKDSIANYISHKYKYQTITSTTSRPMRVNESEGEPYHFIRREQFEAGVTADEFIEYRQYNTLVDGVPDIWYYGVRKNEVLPDKNYIVVLDLWGLEQFKKHFDNTVSFFISVPDEQRKQRAINGRLDFDEVEWERRLADDKTKFSKEKIQELVDCIIPNLSFEKCISGIMEKVGQDI